MAEHEVPRDHADQPQTAAPEPEPSPARAAVLRWRAIWADAEQIQAETGRAGRLTDWESGWDFSNHAADTVDPRLVTATKDDLQRVADFFEKLEWAADRLDGLFHDGCPPETAGALLNVLEWIRDGLGINQRAIDVRDIFPPLDPVLEHRLAEMQAVIINYWATFASGRSKQIADLEAEIAALHAQVAEVRADADDQRARLEALERGPGPNPDDDGWVWVREPVRALHAEAGEALADAARFLRFGPV